jgi:hypothetical protein
MATRLWVEDGLRADQRVRILRGLDRFVMQDSLRCGKT